MQRLRLKADGRIVELRDGREFPLAPALPAVAPADAATTPTARDLRRRARLTRWNSPPGANRRARRDHPHWEQGKRMPRGPARALLAVIAHAPETVFRRTRLQYGTKLTRTGGDFGFAPNGIERKTPAQSCRGNPRR